MVNGEREKDEEHNGVKDLSSLVTLSTDTEEAKGEVQGDAAKEMSFSVTPKSTVTEEAKEELQGDVEGSEDADGSGAE